MKGYDYKSHIFKKPWKVENVIQKWYKQATDEILIVLIHFIMNFNTIDKKKSECLYFISEYDIIRHFVKTFNYLL